VGQDLVKLQAPFDDLVAPMISRLIEPRKLDFQKMFDNVLAKRLRRAEIAASQILDLLGDVLDV
jgi:hypothetical protein